MAKVTADKEPAALLVIDPYNDFISDEERHAALDINISN